jgi:hypothetical protein
LIIENNQLVIGKDSNSQYLSLVKLNTDPLTLCLGGCDLDYALRGGFREFKLINQWLSTDTISKLKNHYLFYDEKLLAYYRLGNTLGLREEFRPTNLRGKALSSNSSLTVTNELVPNDIC